MLASPVHLALLAAAFLAAALVMILWRRRRAPAARPLAALMLAVSIWSLTYMLSLTGDDIDSKLLWANMAFFGVVLVPASWLTFALAYSGHDLALTRRTIATLAVMPALTLLAVWTNPWHGLFRSAIWLVRDGELLVLEARLGPIFWVHTAYSYLLLMYGTIVLVRSLMRMPPAYLGQAFGLIVGMALPWASNILYLSGMSPRPYLDLTPFAFGLSGVLLTWELLRSGLLELVPIARSTVFQSIAGGVIVIDSQGRIVDINPAALALIGGSSREVVGQQAAQALASWPEAVERYRTVSAAHEEIETRVGDELRAFDLRISPIYDRARRLRGRVIVLHDITERRRAAAELQRQNVELAELAEQNARLYAAVQQELAERKQAEEALSLAKEAAEVASRAKSRFLRNMSHELRTPLTAILGYTDLLQLQANRLGQTALNDDISRIQSAGRHLLELISDVIDVTRIESERLELRSEQFEVAGLVRAVADSVAPLAARGGNQLQIDCPEACGVMWGDQMRVRQILLNVLGNATKFTEGGQITLAVRGTQPHDAPGAQISFAVSDTGIGLSREQQRLLFREFVQVDDSSTRRYGGSGLGLAISQRLCQLMGGQISVDSELGRGSTFTITLPRHIPPVAARDEEGPAA